MAISQLDTFRILVEQSSLLTESERLQWLELLPLMNDKQLLELRGILRSPDPTQPAKPMELPSLRHIVNMPQGVLHESDSVAVRQPVPAQPSAAKPAGSSISFGQWQDHVKQTLTEKELPAAKVLPTATVSRPTVAAQPIPRTTIAAKPAANLTALATTKPQPQKPRPVAGQAVVPKTLEQLQTMSLESLEKFEFQELVTQMQQLVQQHGYFEVLLRLEQSPLFAAYVAAGSEALKTNTQLKGEDFKLVSDLLRAIQINQ
jgi:hypothetical protein